MENISKICRRCGRKTPFDQLVKHKQCTYGVDALCKECNRKSAHDWYHDPKNLERTQQTRSAYRLAHRDELNRAKLDWQIKNRERYRANHLRWRDKNRQQLRERRRNFRLLHPDKEQLYAEKFYAKPENQEKRRVRTRNRRAYKRRAEGKHTAEDIRQQLGIQKGLCYWCSQPLNKKFHADHVVPLIRGGTNYPDNIVCACEKCNCAKGDRIIYVEWQPPNPLFPKKE